MISFHSQEGIGLKCQEVSFNFDYPEEHVQFEWVWRFKLEIIIV